MKKIYLFWEKLSVKILENNMKNILIGMAGHIDHGKTTIIKYLTGKNTDTLPEEKKEG